MDFVVEEDYWAYNFTQPTYQRFFADVFNTFSTACRRAASDGSITPSYWMQTVKNEGHITREDIACFVGLAFVWSILRYAVTALILKPHFFNSNLGKHEKKKAPESVWKLAFYISTWCYSVYLLFFTKYDFFFNPPLTFYKWKIGQDVPTEIYAFYMVQLSFYFHSVYATLFMDVWRKDSNVMLMHHFVTLLLVGFSYVFRFANVGVLVLFCHDVTDIVLEFTKLVLYHKTKGGAWTKICDLISTIGFVLFGTFWFVFRLYWYPLKAMYAAGHTCVVVMKREPPFYIFFNILLWILLCMNIYWFKYIVIMAYYVITGKAREVGDVREYEDESSDDETKVKKKQHATNGSIRENGMKKKEL